jgi:transcriptional regulator GlxA family with amidase domain
MDERGRAKTSPSVRAPRLCRPGIGRQLSRVKTKAQGEFTGGPLAISTRRLLPGMLGILKSSYLHRASRMKHSKADSPAQLPLIGFYIYPGHGTFDLSGALTAFKFADRVDRPGHYETVVLSKAGGLVRSREGVDVMSVAAPDRPIDTLVVIGGPGVFDLEEADIAGIRRYGDAARRTTSICTGSFLLAAAGLLHGRRATTHWAHAARLAREFPSVQVEADRIYVRDGPFWSSAGGAAGIDLALALIEDDYGSEIARTIARYFVVPFRRRGGQSQYSEMLELDPQSDRIARTLAFMQAHLPDALTVDRLATIACLSPRQFSRAFHAETGETPAGAVQRLRAEAAKARVETGSESIESIAISVGFIDPERMRRAFVRRFGKSPQALRRASRGQSEPAPGTLAQQESAFEVVTDSH